MLEQSGSHTLSDALNSVPGVSFIGKTVGNSEPFQMNGFTDEYVKILIDGVPVSTGGSSAIYSYLSVDNIDHIEVIEGSSSAICGSDAIAGVISEDQQLMAGLNSQYSGYNDDNADSETEASFKTANLSLSGRIQSLLTALCWFRASAPFSPCP